MKPSALIAIVTLAGCAAATSQRADSNLALSEATAAWTAAMDAKDAARVASFFAENAFVMYPQPAPTLGRQANHEAWARYFARENAEHPFTTDTIVIAASGDLAYTRGRAAGRYGPATNPTTFGGRYIAVWQRVDREWKIVALSANTHRPPPPMDSTAR